MFLLGCGCTLRRDVFLVFCRVLCANVVSATSSEGFLGLFCVKSTRQHITFGNVQTRDQKSHGKWKWHLFVGHFLSSVTTFWCHLCDQWPIGFTYTFQFRWHRVLSALTQGYDCSLFLRVGAAGAQGGSSLSRHPLVCGVFYCSDPTKILPK